jgi:hypothetical protein
VKTDKPIWLKPHHLVLNLDAYLNCTNFSVEWTAAAICLARYGEAWLRSQEVHQSEKVYKDRYKR